MLKKYILLLLSMMILTVSCGNFVARKAFNDHMKIIQSGDMDKLRKWDPSMDNEEIKFLLEEFKKITYKINKIETKGNIAIINVTMKVPDFSVYSDEFQKKIIEKYKNSNITNQKEAEKMTIQEAITFFAEKVKKDNLTYIEKNVNVEMEKKGSVWVIEGDKNKEFVYALTLGLDK